jgi:hypothetical protein
MKRIANKDAREFVQSKQAFKGANLYAVWTREKGRAMYVVYSYGGHWPLFMYDDEVGVWFENAERVSVTTSKHRTLAHPHVSTIVCDADTIKQAMKNGVNAVLLRGEAT